MRSFICYFLDKKEGCSYAVFSYLKSLSGMWIHIKMPYKWIFMSTFIANIPPFKLGNTFWRVTNVWGWKGGGWMILYIAELFAQLPQLKAYYYVNY